MSWDFELVAGPYNGTTEGPVWDGQALLFSHIPANRILRYDPKTGDITEYFTGTQRTNGLCFDSQGNLYGCQSAGRRIVRFESDGTTITLPAPSTRRQTPQQPQRPGRGQAGPHLVYRSLQRHRRGPGTGSHVGFCGWTPNPAAA